LSQRTMVRRPAQTQSLHDRMVLARARGLLSEGYEVRADVNGYNRPPTVNGHVPDIYARKVGSTVIAEAETCDTIESEHTRSQYVAFSSVPQAAFHVIVPETCLTSAKEAARRWGISVDKWWYM